MRQLAERFSEVLWNRGIRMLLRVSEDIPVALGTRLRKSSLLAIVSTRELWQQLSCAQKLRSIVGCGWEPDDELVRKVARETFLVEVFGGEDDLGPEMLELSHWHYSQECNLECLQPDDIRKTDALDAFTGLTRLRLREGITAPPLRLQLLNRAPAILLNVLPMLIKVPVIAFQHFLTIGVAHTFNSIRGAKHQHADDLIAYIYEVMFLQQKIAIALFEFARLTGYAARNKNNAVLINAEVTAILAADLIFTYLKASLEKTIAIAGYAWGIGGLDSKKAHRAKIKALEEGLPREIRDTPYCRFFFEFAASHRIEELNNFRSGILHKKGIADLQPHNFASFEGRKLPLQRLFSILHEQHAKNTTLLLCALALLTDKLVLLAPPQFGPVEFFERIGEPGESLRRKIFERLACMENTGPEGA